MHERRWALALVCSVLILALGTGMTYASLSKEETSAQTEGQLSLDVSETGVIEPPYIPDDLVTDVIFLTLRPDVACRLNVSWSSGNATLSLSAHENYTIPLDEPCEVSITLIEADEGSARISYTYVALGYRIPYLYLAVPGAILCLLGLGLLAMSFTRFLMERAGFTGAWLR